MVRAGFAGLLVVLMLGAAVAGMPVQRTVGGVAFPTTVLLPQGALSLRGAGVLRYGVFFRAYVAALYADDSQPQVLLGPDTTRRLEIVYFVDIDRERITAFAEQRLREQLAADAWSSLAPRVRAWHAAFRDVHDGDRYVMQYSDGWLSLSLNGVTLISVADPELATAYFGIWLGEQPIDAGLRRALLGEGRVTDV